MHILLAARTLIAQRWKIDMAPNASEVLRITQSHYVYESLLASRQGNTKQFDSHWKIWKAWYNVQ